MAENLELALKIRADIQRAARDIRNVRDELRQFGQGGRAAESGVRGLNQELDQTERRMRSVSDTGRTVRRLLVSLGAIALFRGAIQNTIRQEQALAQVEQRLRSTGAASGFTAEQLAKMAGELQKVSNFGDEAVLEMESLLLTFTNVRGDVFERTTRAVLDMSVAMGQDLKSSALQLGKVLSDPVSRLGELSRVGIVLTDSQKELVKQFVKTGDLAAAQGVILDELQVEFGGAARAARDTFGGALESLGNAFGDLLEGNGGLDDAKDSVEELTAILQDPKTVEAVNNITSAMISGFTRAAQVVSGLNLLIAGPADELLKLDDKAIEVQKKIQYLREALDAPRALRGTLATKSGVFGEETFFESDKSIRARIAALTEELQQIYDAMEKVREKRGQELLSNIRKDQEKSAGASVKSSAPSGPSDEDLKAAEKARQALDNLDQSLRTQVDTFDQSDAAVLRYRLSVGDLSDEVDRLGSDGQRLADSIVAQAEQLQQLTAAKEAEAEAERQRREALKVAEEERQRLLSEGQSLTESLRTPQEEYNAALADYQRLLEAGAISQETFNRAVEGAKERLADASADTSEFAQQAARNIQTAFGQEALSLMQGKWQNFGDAVVNVIQRIAAEAASAEIAQALFGDYGKNGKSDFGGIIGTVVQAFVQHEGGASGTGRRRAVSPFLFDNAPRLHQGLRADEFPTILQRGEEVLAKDDPRNSANGAPAGGITNIINLQALDGRDTLEKLRDVDQDLALMQGQAASRYNLNGG